jgi:membrane-bound ClpP family serine protease
MDYTVWALVLLLLGFIFLVLEFFVPSGGLLAAMCALSFLGAIVCGFLAGPWTGVVILLTECAIVPASAAAAVRWWPVTPIGRWMLVQRPASPDEVLPETVAYRGLRDLIGRRGNAKGLMLPSGLVVIDGRTYDAVSEGHPIESGQPVIVVQVSTQRLVVRPDNTIEAQLADSDLRSPARSANEPLVADIPDPFAE